MEENGCRFHKGLRPQFFERNDSEKVVKILLKCLECTENAKEVSECQKVTCPLYGYRLNKLGNNPDSEELNAYKLKCLDCCKGQIIEVKSCPVSRCSLYKFTNRYWA